MPIRLKSRALYHGPAGRDWRRIIRRVLLILMATALLITAGLIALGALVSGLSNAPVCVLRLSTRPHWLFRPMVSEVDEHTRP